MTRPMLSKWGEKVKGVGNFGMLWEILIPGLDWILAATHDS